LSTAHEGEGEGTTRRNSRSAHLAQALLLIYKYTEDLKQVQGTQERDREAEMSLASTNSYAMGEEDLQGLASYMFPRLEAQLREAEKGFTSTLHKCVSSPPPHSRPNRTYIFVLLNN
jgi:SHS2 domain-containing protein